MKFGIFTLEGDYKIRDIKERGLDRDFYIDPLSSVVNLRGDNLFIQFTKVSFINFRTSLEASSITLHIHSEEDLFSSIANISFNIDKSPISIKKEDMRVYIDIPKSWIIYRE